MKALNRVAVTGLGVITPLGTTTKEVWENITAGKSGVSNVTRVKIDDLPVRIAGEIKDFTIAENLLSAKERDRYDRFLHFVLHTADEAIRDADLLNKYDAKKIGSIYGIGMGGFPMTEEAYKGYLERGHRRVSPFLIPGIIPNMASGLVSINYGFKGLNFTISSACASSGHAISTAATEIMVGNLDAAVVGGSESVITTLPMAGFANMKALSKRNEDPQRASRPFDVDRDGFVLGEGAATLVLENYEKAVARGAKIYAELVGAGATSDAHHITAPHPEGEGALGAIMMALEHAGIDPTKVGYINAHGTSTPLGDIGETNAIKRAFGEHAYKLHVSSTKSMIGHLLGAAGAVEALFTIMALHTGTLPPTINLENQDPQCDLNYIPNIAIKKDIEYALTNSFGFGGTNSTLLFKKG